MGIKIILKFGKNLYFLELMKRSLGDPFLINWYKCCFYNISKWLSFSSMKRTKFEQKFEMTIVSLNDSSVNHNGLKPFFSYLFIFTTWRSFHKIRFRHIFFIFFVKFTFLRRKCYEYNFKCYIYGAGRLIFY